jgi:hypothetical protein
MSETDYTIGLVITVVGIIVIALAAILSMYLPPQPAFPYVYLLLIGLVIVVIGLCFVYNNLSAMKRALLALRAKK